MRLFVFYNTYKCWREKFPHSSWLFMNNYVSHANYDLFFSVRRFASEHLSQKSILCNGKHLILAKPYFHLLQVSFKIFQFSGSNE